MEKFGVKIYMLEENEEKLIDSFDINIADYLYKLIE